MRTERWWTTADVAEMCNVSTATVRRRASSGQWPHKKIGRLYRFTDDHVQEIKELTSVDTDYFYDSNRIARALREIG